MLKKIILGILLFSFATPVFAQTLNLARARVIEITQSEESRILEEIGVGGVNVTNQTLTAEIIDGEEKGKVVTIENDFIKLKKGDLFFIEKTSIPGEEDRYIVKERDRQLPIYLLLAIFAGIILFFGGKQGLRSIISLAGSFLVIIYLLLPMLMKGYSPIVVSIGFATLILFVAIYFTHGFNRESSVAFGGTIMAVILTGLLAFLSVWVMKLTGFTSEETLFLSLDNSTTLNFQGLLLGGILLGVLGILDDIAITQAAVVSEIYSGGNNLSESEVFKKAIRVGKEHVSALVNTLVLAYTGASLPLLLLFSNYDYPIRYVISQELFATEIVRTIVGSIGLILTVPITTYLAVRFLKGYKGKSTIAHNH